VARRCLLRRLLIRDALFIRWVARATGADGKPIKQSGVDRITVRDGKVVENRIFFDRREFERLGRSLAL
jgi:ketosteroid isomerase-like protein